MTALNNTNPIQIGTNLAGIADWSTQFPFLDAFKSSRPWITQGNGVWNTKEYDELNLDENDWIKSLPSAENPSADYTYVGTLLFRDTGGNYPGGNYVVLYDGEGTLEYGFDGKIDQTASAPGRDVINVTPSNGGIHLKITETDPNGTGNYIRNIRVVPEKYENNYESVIFNPDFVEKTDDYSVLRFMDWMATNNSQQSEWSARTKVENPTYAGSGVPVEIMVELANQTGVDPWFTMPHQATNEYITNFAQIVQKNLDPNLNVYVEFSNEVWNGQFQQASWAIEQGKKEWSDSGTSDYTKGRDWYSKRTTEITQIWDSVFDADKNRVIGVMAAQAANPWTASRALEYAWSSDQKSHADYGIDAIAIAPYFGNYLGSPTNAAEVESWTKDSDGGLNKLFQEITQGGVLSNGVEGGALKQAYDWTANYIDLAKQQGLDLIAYEGGQHLVGHLGVEDNKAITNLFIAANRDPRMGDIYREYFTKWNELGGGVFANFSDIGKPSKWGSWGNLESLYQQSSPKYDALLDLIGDSNLGTGNPGNGDDSIDNDPNLITFSSILESYGGDQQDKNAQVTISEDNRTLQIEGNGWKKLGIDYSITPDTLLEFEFQSNVEGEIQGIGFDTDDSLSRDQLFKLSGTQNWGINSFDDYVTSSGWQSYQIRVGDYLSGEMNYLTFANDHDVSNPTASSQFRNIRLYEIPVGVADTVSGEMDILSSTNNQELFNFSAANELANTTVL
ncbi:cellulose-binding protein [Coleofasciculus sp. LEGE 07081]|uniref:cellulose-binding protein n=1 Tax=Coleofasciculus sp. LEGE 07081 TaxID=2777967 RepID=UPI00187F9A7E|nr:cellulose-binding protein [Coleofasciculus sp. LEGE 07081]MBE9125275.1 cellulose-binding protein [Coleofasciculus sp. LEGE 07081]